mgnify:CR=1 FL=1
MSSRVTNLADHLPAPMDVEEFLSRLRAYFLDTVPDLEPYALTQDERAAVDALCREKYQTWDWNFGAAPQYAWTRAAKFPYGLVEVHLDVDRGSIRAAALYGGLLRAAGQRRAGPGPGGLPTAGGPLPALQALPLEDYIAGSTAEDLLPLLCP